MFFWRKRDLWERIIQAGWRYVRGTSGAPFKSLVSMRFGRRRTFLLLVGSWVLVQAWIQYHQLGKNSPVCASAQWDFNMWLCRVSLLDQLPATTPVHYQQVTCNGTERSLQTCDLVSTESTNHDSDVYIVCLPNVSLGAMATDGMYMIYLWGTQCWPIAYS